MQDRAWLDGLPERIERYAREWQLEVQDFLPGGLLSCCLTVALPDGEAGVLKLSGPWTRAEPEAVALRHWSGGPAPLLLRADCDVDALLLEQITPGEPVNGRVSAQDIQAVAALIAALHSPAVSDDTARRLPRLAEVVERDIATAGTEALAHSPAESAKLSDRLDRACRRAAELLESSTGETVLLQGDLESKNILRCHARGSVAIDPLPCIGDPAYDAAMLERQSLDDAHVFRGVDVADRDRHRRVIE